MARAASRKAPRGVRAGPPAHGPGLSIAHDESRLHHDLARKLAELPHDLGYAMLILGVVGVAIPGPVPMGTPFVVLGTIVLWPGLLARTGGPLARRCPCIFRILVDFADHLRSDLERRYPGSTRD